MWNKLSKVANQAKSIAKNVAQEAYETVEELRSVHQDDWNRRSEQGFAEGTPEVAAPTYVAAGDDIPVPPPMLPVPVGSTLTSVQTAATTNTSSVDVTARLQALKAKLQADKVRRANTASTTHSVSGSQPTSPGLSKATSSNGLLSEPTAEQPAPTPATQAPSLVSAYAPPHVNHTPHQAPSWLPTKPAVFQPGPPSPSPPASTNSQHSLQSRVAQPPWVAHSAAEEQQAHHSQPQSPLPFQAPPQPAASPWIPASVPAPWVPAVSQPMSPAAAADSAAKEYDGGAPVVASPAQQWAPATAALQPPQQPPRTAASSFVPTAPLQLPHPASERDQLPQPHGLQQQPSPTTESSAQQAEKAFQEALEMGERQEQMASLEQQLAEQSAVVAKLHAELATERAQHAAAQTSLTQAQAKVDEEMRARQAELATLTEVGEQLAKFKEAEAQLQEEQRLHERTRQQLRQLQDLQHGSDDRSHQMSEALMELQNQLEEERDKHTATRESLRSSQKEQQKLQAAASQAEQALQGLEEERQASKLLKEQLRILQEDVAAGSSATLQAQHAQQQLVDEREEHSRAREQLQALQREYQTMLAEAQRAELAEQQLRSEREARVDAEKQLEALQHELHSLAGASEQAGQVQELLMEERVRKEQAQERAADLEERLALAEERLEREATSSAAAGKDLAQRDAIWQQELMQQQALYQQLLEAHQELQQQQQAAGGAAAGSTRELSRLELEVQEARDGLIAERSKTAALQEQVASLNAQLDSAHAAAMAAAAHSSADDIEGELASSQAKCGRLQLELDRLLAEKAKDMQAGQLGGEHESRLAELQAALDAANVEKAAAKQQLARLKQQMLSEQDDEEEKIRWRVDAEVKLALEKAQRDMALTGGASTAEVARLQEQLSQARARVDELENDLANWEAAVAARDVELQNLQRALGELSYESEAAERLRGEMRGLQAEMHALRKELDHAKLNTMQLEQAKQQSDAAVAAAESEAAAQREAESQLQQECINLQRALQESTRKVQALSMDSGSMIDRRIVVKMLITYFERHHSQEVLDLMTKMLGFTEEETQLIMASQRQRFGGGPSLASDVAGGANGVKGSLADQWIGFLVEQVQAQEEGGGEHAQQPPAAGADGAAANITGGVSRKSPFQV